MCLFSRKENKYTENTNGDQKLNLVVLYTNLANTKTVIIFHVWSMFLKKKQTISST